MSLENPTTIEELAGMIQRNFSSNESQIKLLEKNMNERFERVDERFEKIDERFEKIDERFDKIEARLEIIEKKIDAMGTDQEAKRIEINYIKNNLNSYTTKEEFSEIEKRVAKLEAVST